MTRSDSRLVFLTGGDPAGIAPEVVRKALIGLRPDHPIIYLFNADADEEARLHEIDGLKVHSLSADPHALDETVASLGRGSEGGVWLLNVSRGSALPGCGESLAALPGKAGAVSGALAFRALNLACHLITKHGCRSLVTAPLSKEWVARSGHSDFSGHTGFLASCFASRVVMLMHGEGFSVIPLTEHVPLREVHRELRRLVSDEPGEQLMRVLQSLADSSAFRGRAIALCGLNPHCGEGGLIGGEEEDFLIPFAGKLRERGVPIEGPLAADTLFMPEIRKKYRLMLSCYHDQGLIPFKALEGERGINVTVGLPFLRTSPDHGTAYGIAGREMADPTSMRRALETALGGHL